MITGEVRVPAVRRPSKSGFKNSIGATIATGVRDSVTNLVTVTCVGEQPVQLNPACPTPLGPTQATVDAGQACTIGTCS